MIFLNNGKISAAIDEVGAELKSIYSIEKDMEFMWQPGNEIWDHSSLVLFPNPGRISRDRTIIGGRVYPAKMHGFASDSLFEVLSQTETSAEFLLKANERTMRSFPYDFRLSVSFELTEDGLKQGFKVWSEDGQTMYFCLGAHPGFYLPLVLGESGNDYLLRFDRPQNIKRFTTQKGTMLLTGERTDFLVDETDVQLSENYFDNGSLLLEGIDADKITLLSKKSGHFVEMGIKGFPYMCLWGNPAKNAMICVEPWCGTSDLADTDHVWETKLGIEKVSPGDVFERELTFRVG